MLGGKNSKNKQSLGYTIIEVMIVLAVSGVMFLIAANFINGKQERTAFTEGVNDTASKLQDAIEQVTDGQYSDIPLGCTFDGTHTTITDDSLHTKVQGANSPCVFLGKLWYFPGLTSDSSKTSDYNVLSLAGGRVDTTGAPITDPVDAYPAVANSLNASQVINQSLEVNKIGYYDGTHFYVLRPPIQAFGFLQSQGTADANGNLASGAQTVGLYYVNQPPDRDGAGNVTLASNSLKSTKGILLCVTDDTRYALITVGVASNGTTTSNPLAVNVVMEPTGTNCEGALS